MAFSAAFSSPITRHNGHGPMGHVFWSLRRLNCLFKIHMPSNANHENHYVMEGAKVQAVCVQI
jgi:hypothetical protein